MGEDTYFTLPIVVPDRYGDPLGFAIASAFIDAVGMLEREGCKITFGQYFKIAFLIMLLTIVISTGYAITAYLI